MHNIFQFEVAFVSFEFCNIKFIRVDIYRETEILHTMV